MEVEGNIEIGELIISHKNLMGIFLGGHTYFYYKEISKSDLFSVKMSPQFFHFQTSAFQFHINRETIPE